MLLGALVDAGADRHEVAATIAGLGVDGYALTFERVQRGGIAATWANVVVARPLARRRRRAPARPRTHHDHVPHRPAKVIRELLTEADLPEPVRRMALDVFAVLAEAEGAVHGIDPDAVEFHEVGSLDAIVDVVGVAAALHTLGIERVVAGPVGCGHGTIRAAHGDLPNPPPAVARLLASRAIPVIGVDTGMELATPTGVAILAALAESFGPLPAMTPIGRRLWRRHRRPGRAAQRRPGDRRRSRRRRRAVAATGSGRDAARRQRRRHLGRGPRPRRSRRRSERARSTRG